MVLIFDLEREQSLLKLLGEALSNLGCIEAKHGLVGVRLLDSDLDQGFRGTRSDCLEDLDPFQLLVTLQSHLFAILLKSAASKHLKNGLTAFFR